MQRPILENHKGVTVVRDDLLPGGTKARFILGLMKGSSAQEFVYAGPPEGGAQVALAVCAYQASKQATLFISARRQRTAYTERARGYGAKIVEVRPGYLSTVRARAKLYATERAAELLPFGLDLPEAIAAISVAAKTTGEDPDEVWCACGSGVLRRGQAAALGRRRNR